MKDWSRNETDVTELYEISEITLHARYVLVYSDFSEIATPIPATRWWAAI